jgi:site-specific DNA-methyltransferase (adenine-specific)
MITATNEDNMLMMARYPDDYFDLAIVDPPYGLDFAKYNRVSKASNGEKYISNNYKKGDWDNIIPTLEYFKELFRVSKNQIVWGGNYFNLPPNQNFIFWYKQNPVSNFSDGEYAWTSFKKPALCFDYRYYGNLEGNTSASKKYHPTQKPIKLYEWTLTNYAKEGDKIVDTHRGSASLDIACHNLGFDLVTCELDTDYFNDGNKRLKQHQNQQIMKF